MPEKKGQQNPKMVDRDEIFYYFPTEEHFSVLYLSILFFYAPNVANLGFWRIEPKIAF